jgi:hypothetical protein
LFVNRKRKDVRDGGHDRVAERLQARDAVYGVSLRGFTNFVGSWLHPIGNAISVSTHEGFSLPPVPFGVTWPVSVSSGFPAASLASFILQPSASFVRGVAHDSARLPPVLPLSGAGGPEAVRGGPA